MSGLLTKAGGGFKIAHPLDPENKDLNHSFVESPEMRNAYFGQAITINGSVVITLPDWWEALNGSDKAEFNYLFTPIGKCCQLYVNKEIENSQFEVSSAEDTCKFSWFVSAIRHDKFAEENRLQVETEKEEGH